jgi:hypothetical protein
MSKTSDYRPEQLEHMNLRAGADLRLRLLTLKDLAHAFLEELGTVGDEGVGAEAAEGPIDFYEEVRRFEIELIQSALRRTNGVQTEAAALLGLKPSTLHAKLKLYQLSASDFSLRHAAGAAHTAAAPDAASRGYDADRTREEQEDARRVPVLA